MKAQGSLNRRQFLGSAVSASVGGFLLPENLRASEGERLSGENEHFSWYRPAPGVGPYIDSHRDNKAFGFGDGKISLSEDNGKTWPHEAAFPDADKVTFSVILKNGNILFSTFNQLFLSTDNLKTFAICEAAYESAATGRAL